MEQAVELMLKTRESDGQLRDCVCDGIAADCEHRWIQQMNRTCMQLETCMESGHLSRVSTIMRVTGAAALEAVVGKDSTGNAVYTLPHCKGCATTCT